MLLLDIDHTFLLVCVFVNTISNFEFSISVKLAVFSFGSSLVLSCSCVLFNYILARALTEVLQWGTLKESCHCRLKGIGVTIQKMFKNTLFSYFPSLGEMKT